MGIVPPSPQQPLSEDPDDFRPASSWRLVVDPDGKGRVRTRGHRPWNAQPWRGAG